MERRQCEPSLALLMDFGRPTLDLGPIAPGLIFRDHPCYLLGSCTEKSGAAVRDYCDVVSCRGHWSQRAPTDRQQ